MDEIKPSISKLARLIAIVVIVLSLVTTSIISVSADTNKTHVAQIVTLYSSQSELQNQINALNNQIENAENSSTQISIVEQQLILLNQELSVLNEQIEECESIIEEHQNKIDANKARIDTQHKQNKQRISAMSGILASSCADSNSSINLIAQVSTINRIAQDDKNATNEMSQMLDNIESAKALLEQKEKELTATQMAIISKRQELYTLMIGSLNNSEQDTKYRKYISNQQLEEMELAVEANSVMEIGNGINGFDFSIKNIKHNIDENGIVWAVPCTYKTLSSPFGYRIHPIYGDWRMHDGVDLSNKSKTPIYATRSGVVIDSGYDDSSGYHIVIDHLDGYKSCYLHLRVPSTLKEGDVLAIGDYIGEMGSTGASTGPHLHFGIKYKNKWVDPMDYIS